VSVNEKDFAIAVVQQHVAAGALVLRIHNHGPDAHELIVVRSKGGNPPLRSDGLTVSEEELRPVTMGSLEPGPPGSVRDLSVRLSPGRYLLFCNMAGHYMAGMHTVLVVH
jgi:uncharacterized cupredoxin-like copper-binding protein